MWPESRHYGQENVDAALSYITHHFAADMGGTEILSGLQHVVQKSSLSVNTEIIILTDREVWNSNDIFEFIRETKSSGPKEKTRFFCLGIGEAVSHHLVSGIGRHGGGLAEVVPLDSAGDWMQRVIGMLGAALTPSSWNIEIILDDVSTSDEKSGAGVCIQAPYHIPEFHAFSRGSVYFLFNQEISTKVVKVKATAVASGESVIAELPIEKLETRRTCVHLLAAKPSWVTLRAAKAGCMTRTLMITIRISRLELMISPGSKAKGSASNGDYRVNGQALSSWMTGVH
jgi:von Willebrand factor type A domain